MDPVRLLDLFCGAGGAAVGYHRAGFDVVGVDNRPQPHYPFEFHQADAMTYPLDGYDAVHASPPCQDHSHLKTMHPGRSHGTGWMLPATIERLAATGTPYVVENVSGAKTAMPGRAFTLCGSMFGLQVRRHRLFESSELILAGPCDHRSQPIIHGVYGHGQSSGGRLHRWIAGLPAATVDDWRQAMDIDWMNRDELAQAIPPAYTEHIGRQLLEHLQAAA